MLIECHELKDVPKAVLMWEEGDGKDKCKKFLEVVKGTKFEVHDKWGHKLIATYPDMLRVVQYGDAPASKSKL